MSDAAPEPVQDMEENSQSRGKDDDDDGDGDDDDEVDILWYWLTHFFVYLLTRLNSNK